MAYNVVWSETSSKQLGKLEKAVIDRITRKVNDTAKNPFLFVQKLHGLGLYKLRVGDYRVIMNIENNKMVIFIVEVGNRSVVYRKY